MTVRKTVPVTIVALLVLFVIVHVLSPHDSFNRLRRVGRKIWSRNVDSGYVSLTGKLIGLSPITASPMIDPSVDDQNSTMYSSSPGTYQFQTGQFQRLHRSPPETIHELVFQMRYQNLDLLQELVQNVSDPTHIQYGAYLSSRQVREMITSLENRIQLVDFLQTAFERIKLTNELAEKDSSLEIASVGSTTENEYVVVRTTISVWEALLQTSFYRYEAGRSDGALVVIDRATDYTLPRRIVNLVGTIYNTVQFPVSGLQVHYHDQDKSWRANFSGGYDDPENTQRQNRRMQNGDRSQQQMEESSDDMIHLVDGMVKKPKIPHWITKDKQKARGKVEEVISQESDILHTATTIAKIATGSVTRNREEHINSLQSGDVLPQPQQVILWSPSSALSDEIQQEILSQKRSEDSSYITEEQEEGFVDPHLLGAVYGFAGASGNALATQAVYGTLGEVVSTADLEAFHRHNGLKPATLTATLGTTDAAEHVTERACEEKTACSEANLDVQFLMAVSPSSPTAYYYWTAAVDPWLQWLRHVAALTKPPLVISVSYGSDEAAIPASYAESFNVQAMKLAAQGVTIVASSGNNGVNGDGQRCGYIAQFPATSPFVTAVGGTQGPEMYWRTSNPQPIEIQDSMEVSCTSSSGGTITSGGGFSWRYSTPDWQAEAVEKYFSNISYSSSTNLPHPGFNRYGRGYPDLSALAKSYQIVLNGELTTVSGTSAAAPVIAGMISLVNAARLARGQSPVGWFNPTLYQFGHLFVRDILRGDGNYCDMVGRCCEEGFPVKEGWDPVTGLGVLNFQRFRSVMLALGEGHEGAASAEWWETMKNVTLPIAA